MQVVPFELTHEVLVWLVNHGKVYLLLALLKLHFVSDVLIVIAGQVIEYVVHY